MLDALKSRSLWRDLVSHHVLSPCLILGILLTTQVSFATVDEDSFETIEEARDIEKKVIALIDQLRPSVVGLEIAFSQGRRRPPAIAGGSGSIIDLENGLILTAGHVGRTAHLPVKIYLHDGTQIQGETLGQYLDGQEDCGLVAFDPKQLDTIEHAPLAEARMGDSTKVEVGDWVLAFGHTHGVETEPWRPPPARIGRITGNHDYVLTMDSPLNVGDSGGPLFSLDGLVVGINESVSRHPHENAATAIEVALDRFDQMLFCVSGGATLPRLEDDFQLLEDVDSTHPIIFDPYDSRSGRDEPSMLNVLTSATWDAGDWVVRIFSDDQQISLGLIVDESGLVLTKASEIDPRDDSIQVGTASGLLLEARPLAIDGKLDLLLLQLPPGNWTAAPISDDHSIEAGTILISAGPDSQPISFGICELDTYSSDLSFYDRAFLGVGSVPLVSEDGGAIIQQVVPGSAAARSGIRTGDILLSIDEKPLRGRDALIKALSGYRAGDTIEINRLRGERRDVIRTRLGYRTFSAFENEVGNFGSGLNRHDTGFGEVIQHDGLLLPHECGGPLVDLSGRFIGMNIARSDRTKTFALTGSVIRSALKRMRKGGDMVKVWKPQDPRSLQLPIKPNSKGIYRLDASSAQLFGPSVQFQYLPTRIRNRSQICIGALRSSRDEVLWVLDKPSPGAYEIWVEQACDNEAAGMSYEIGTSRESIDSVALPTANWLESRPIMVGELNLGEDDPVFTFQPLQDSDQSLMLLHRIELRPITD
jgi:S1-C subfamily serine protease